MYNGLLLVILALIVLHAPLIVVLGSNFPDYSLIVKAWKEILMFVALPMAAVLVTRAGLWPKLTGDKLFWLIIAYVAVHAVSLLMWQGFEAVAAGLAIDLRYIAYFSLVYVAVLLQPSLVQTVKKLAIGGAVVVIGFGTLQLALPYDFLSNFGYGDDTIRPYTTIDRNYDFVRYQSTLRGPNPYGAYAMSVAVVALAWLLARKPRQWKADWRVWLLLAGSLLGVYMSYARSAAIGLVAGAGIVVGLRARKLLKLGHWLALGLVVMAVIAAGLVWRDSDFVSNVILHEDPEEGNNINSNDGHWKSLVKGTERMLAQPFGAGIGSTGSASLLGEQSIIIENQYLFIAHEVGWLGFGLFIAIFTMIMLRLWKQRGDPWALGLFASGVGLALIGLILPVWVDDTVSIVWWGLVAAVLAANAARQASLSTKH